MRCAFHVDGSPTQPWSDDLAALPVVGECIHQDGLSYLVLEVDWFGADRGYSGDRQMALVSVTEIEAIPPAAPSTERTPRRPGRVILAALRDRGILDR